MRTSVPIPALQRRCTTFRKASRRTTTQAAADLYNHRLQHVEASDYPALWWLRMTARARRLRPGRARGSRLLRIRSSGRIPHRVGRSDMPLVIQGASARGRTRRGIGTRVRGVIRPVAADVLMAKGVLQYGLRLAGFSLASMHCRFLVVSRPASAANVSPCRISALPYVPRIGGRAAISRRPRAGLSRWNAGSIMTARSAYPSSLTSIVGIGVCFVLAGEQASGVPRAARIDQGQPAQGGDIP
jgi:hypothetical protein